MTLLTFNVIKVLGVSVVASTVAILWCPLLIDFLYKHKLWKKSARTKAISGEDAVIFNALHKERETKVPRMGGLLIFITTVAVSFLFYIISILFPGSWLARINFLSRSQTWLPLFTFIAASLFGLLDDALVVSSLGKYIGGGISFKKRLLIVVLIGLACGLWFYSKLGWDVISIPLIGQFSMGILGLTTTLAVVAFLTDSVFVLPIIAGLLVIEVGSVIIQLLSKKLLKKKIFLSTPIHHHFEAIGWPAYKVTMRFWVVGIVLAIIGVVIKLLG